MKMNKAALMSLVFALALFGAGNALAAGSSANDLTAKAVALVNSMGAGNFSAAETNFNANLKTSLTPSKLKAEWNKLVTLSGPYQKTGHTRLITYRGHQVVIVETLFKKDTWKTQVAFDRSGKIAVLRFKGQ